MIAKTVYAAFDGAYFDKESECKKHEDELIKNHVGFYDCDGAPVSLDDIDNITKVKFIRIPDTVNVETFKDFIKGNRISKSVVNPNCFSEPGFYISTKEFGRYYRYNPTDIEKAKSIMETF